MAIPMNMNINGEKMYSLFKKLNNVVLLSLIAFFMTLIALSIFGRFVNTKEGLAPAVKGETDEEKKIRESAERKQTQDKQLSEIENSAEKEINDDEKYPPTEITKDYLPEPLKEE
jgi:hypothetical protein